ncbi:ROK family protein [Enterococcus sp. BWM-S5]|uniref:ROK family protein n=1 Tax=Enterococcus larvae TaxID=2794352 RepID=A0ABS4CNK9_9ENTE|nr:ROK family protein [Enterococcus larvae]MBP1047572.1 ROK family protein [Enterococcus larvae]
MQPGTPNQLKNSNINRLRKIIYQKKQMTKPALAEQSGLSIMTVNNLMRELLSNQEVIETKSSVSTGGRRASIFEFNAMHRLILTLCLLEKNKTFAFLFSVHDLNGNILVQEEISGDSFDKTLAKDQIEGFLVKYPAIGCLVIGLPGVEHDGIVQVMDFSLMKGERLKSYFEEAFGFEVILENDVNAVAYGYSQAVETTYRNAVVGLYYPETFPPGAGVVLNDRIVKGRNGVAGEIAHLPSDPDWATFSFTESATIGNLLNNIQTYMSLYDPDCFIIYRNRWLDEEQLKVLIEGRIKTEFPFIDLPAIILSKEFHHDYVFGLFSLGIKQLNKELEHFD